MTINFLHTNTVITAMKTALPVAILIKWSGHAKGTKCLPFTPSPSQKLKS